MTNLFKRLVFGLSKLQRRLAPTVRRLSPAVRKTHAKPPIAGMTPLPEDMANTIRHFSNPGPLFETRATPDSAPSKQLARAIAFYLPQFHSFDENDRWWGKGFTEWRNVARGAPRFAGHYQPRIPRDLGFYDLSNTAVMAEQAELARAAGVSAFCFYYYWFNGKRLMETPLDLFAASDIEQNFCIMWANENWTRRWDGRDDDVLIRQEYLDADEDAFIEDTARYMAHERYVRVAGRPLFIIYRAKLLPRPAETIARWRDKWTAELGVAPWIYMVQSYSEFDPRDFGVDGAVEFPPHKVSRGVPRRNAEQRIFDPDFTGQIRAYDDVVKRSLDERAPPYPLIKTVSPHWDNDARREGRGVTLHGSTPAKYQRWLQGAIDHAVSHPAFEDEPLVFINAWNEWAEAAYLEPDVYYGHAYLNATYRAVTGAMDLHQQSRILLVGHDAFRNGAQMLLLSLAGIFSDQFGMEVIILLKRGGPLLTEYQKHGRTVVLERPDEQYLPALLDEFGVAMAICNTSVTGNLVQAIQQTGARVISLVHELPKLIEEYGLEDNLRQIAHSANHVVFASAIVQAGFRQFAPDIKGISHIRPQGTYKVMHKNPAVRSRIRAELGIGDNDRLVINAGYADNRKGFDLYVQSARRLSGEDSRVHFLWVGARSADMSRWLKSELAGSLLDGRLHLMGFTDKIADYYSASDCLFLSSREDPYPTVVLEAMNAGLPVVLFDKATGFDDIMMRHCNAVDMHDLAALDQALKDALYEDSSVARSARIAHVETDCRLDDYAFDLLHMLNPSATRVVPSV